ncbi:toxin transporter [Halomicrococcus sp. SG-WS-1]|uniref:toxin transporter n=1 Tax=Halomicrococcus sp. SG-WS-1 TaxID=3439057 RepID=UPI003F79C5DF
MKKTLTMLVALTVVSTMFAGGALAHTHDNDKTNQAQWASNDARDITQDNYADVDQRQNVRQANYNSQKAAAVNYRSGFGDDTASVTQVSSQSNSNAQIAEVEQENTGQEIDQEQESES